MTAILLVVTFPNTEKTVGRRMNFSFSSYYFVYLLVVTLRPSRLKKQSQFSRKRGGVPVSFNRFTTIVLYQKNGLG